VVGLPTVVRAELDERDEVIRVEGSGISHVTVRVRF
jgi:hypothetical protein